MCFGFILHEYLLEYYALKIKYSLSLKAAAIIGKRGKNILLSGPARSSLESE